ncbi:MAG: hypothetical protein HC806_05235 [Anaerolineae bacterium]|nr:hypothetical protein [Anaerolineae bacterium]
MSWLAFSYSLTAQSGSTPRVTLWRRLKRLGAIAPTGSVYLLPTLDECWEAFQWLAQEIKLAGGDALIMRVEQFEGQDDAQIASLFNQARAGEYTELESQLAELESQIDGGDVDALQTALARLQKQHNEIARADYFHAPEGVQLAARLNQTAQRLHPIEDSAPAIVPVSLTEYQNRTWVTRPRPFVDRLAAIWLIRRFIDPDAIIRYASEPAPDDVSFDMPEAVFGHVGSFCTFETMLRAFNLSAPALFPLAEIVHEVDLWDGRYIRPEATGLDTILRGWHAANLSDAELETHGLALFDGLFAALSPSPVE